jgi:hypothetical protein
MSNVSLLSHVYNVVVNNNLHYIAHYIIFELGQAPCTYKGSTTCKYILRVQKVKRNTVISIPVSSVSKVVERITIIGKKKN